MKRIQFVACIVFCLVIIPTTLSAGIVTLDQVDRGWYNEYGYHYSENDNTVMHYGAGYNAFFMFDLSSVVDPVTSATLELELEQYYWPGQTAVEVDVYEVLTPASTVTADHVYGIEGIAIHEDLQDGLVFGSATVMGSDVGSIVSFTLNSSAIDHINSMLGGQVVFGLHTDTTGDIYDHIRWSEGGDVRHHQLELLTTPNAVPEPASIAIFGLGAIGLGIAARRRQQKAKAVG